MKQISKYDWVILIFILIIFNYLLMSIESNSFNMFSWDILVKLNFQAYCAFDMFFGLFYYLSKKI